MLGGTRWPLPVAKNSTSGRRMALLSPEEEPGSDRITNQLMFVPPFPPGGESSGQRFKKMLFHYGLARWFPLKLGKSMFRDAQCSVDTCTTTLGQKQTTDADAIFYHGMFTHSGHPRTPKQVQALKRLYSQGCTKGHDRVVSSDSSSWDPISEFYSEVEVSCDFPPTLHVNAAIEPPKYNELILLFSCPFIVHVIIHKRNE